MHPDEIDHDVSLVRFLVQMQCPEWAPLPVEPVASTGTDNALYRIGEAMVARLPLKPSSIEPAEKEHQWLPVLAPRLPVATPVPLFRGMPTERYPWPWSVYPWFEGEDAITAHMDAGDLARDLGCFIRSLEAIDPTGGPEPSRANFGRGVPLAMRDAMTRDAIRAAGGLVDTDAVTEAWEDALRAPAWDRPPVWVHGDISSGNLVIQDGRLAAVIDWGCLGIGDPACDLVVAWELFDGDARAILRAELGADDAMWARSRGWALSTAMMALPYYQHTNAFMAAQARHKLAIVLNE
jgi:aminoglycoside phosphotransferase (APT) family kinase protein